jgi:hypothetical protein
LVPSPQSRYYNPDSPQWYDYVAVSLYFMHFIVPLGAAFLLWLPDRKMFEGDAAGILILSYMAYLTYLVFPAAPPWLAAQSGLLPPSTASWATLLMHLSDPISLPTAKAEFHSAADSIPPHQAFFCLKAWAQAANYRWERFPRRQGCW